MPLPKGKGDEYQCSHSRGIGSLIVFGKLYGSVDKELGLELNVQLGRSNVGLGRVEGAFIKWLLCGRCVKVSIKM